MTNSPSIITPPCHNNHLFNAPLCNQQSGTRKIINVVFHLLFFAGIPLAVYHIVRQFSRRTIPRIEENKSKIIEVAVDSVVNNKPIQKAWKPFADITFKYSKLRDETLGYALNLLEEHPDVKAVTYAEGITNQPPEKIGRLEALWMEWHWTLTDLVKTHGWAAPVTVQFVDKYLKMSYAISLLSLEDLDKNDKIRQMTFNSYQRKTFYSFPLLYHWVRGMMTYKDDGFYQRPVDPTYAELFYQQGTIQNRWRELHNDFCDHTHFALKDTNPEEVIIPYEWAQKDLNKKFKLAPCTLHF